MQVCISVFQPLQVISRSQLIENPGKRKESCICMHGVGCCACVYLFLWAYNLGKHNYVEDGDATIYKFLCHMSWRIISQHVICHDINCIWFHTHILCI